MRTLLWAWGIAVGCQLLGLIVVLPAQSGSGGGLVLDGLHVMLPVRVGVGQTVCGVVVDELPDPS